MPERKAIIKSADMPEDMQQEAADCSGEALDKFNIEKDIAAYIKKEFDRTHGPTWHCVVGRQFGRIRGHNLASRRCDPMTIALIKEDGQARRFIWGNVQILAHARLRRE
ncbi:hypothetical protein CRM22_005109 [Opisthorchis felineus]|uniref:Dynein light chain n=1 Tax=Opisthorchis felineus TaxID=147828 RepID=A0A4S2LSZ6_OPIFE|nr:hypothetical protein CRM22_005109 [Opisthorchis felineus]